MEPTLYHVLLCNKSLVVIFKLGIYIYCNTTWLLLCLHWLQNQIVFWNWGSFWDWNWMNKAGEPLEAWNLFQRRTLSGSPVWKYFGFTPDEEGRPTNCCFSKCKICFKDVSAKFGNTSNLLKHLWSHHVSTICWVSENKQQPRVVLKAGMEQNRNGTERGTRLE